LDRTSAISDYLKHTDNLADTLNKIHTSVGLDPPISLSPTPALNHTLGNSSTGTKLGNWLFDKGLSNVTGHIGGEAIGAGLGSLVGHPMVGAYLGEKALSPIISSISKPLLENATNSAAARGAIDYVGSVAKGDKLLSGATANLFKSGAEILPNSLVPTQTSRDMLEKSIDHNQNPNNALKIGGNLGHYLPDHASAAAATATTAMGYLNNLKPKQVQMNPLDKPAPVDRASQQKYNRALDIAQQPLMVLQHVKSGTLQPQDVNTLNTIYPALHKKMIEQVSENMIKAQADGHQMPYHQKISAGLLLGKPLDTTNTQPAMQSIMMSNAQGVQQSQAQNSPHRASNTAMKSVDKMNALYQTPLQAREADRHKS
jgi:hypothetical protein